MVLLVVPRWPFQARSQNHRHPLLHPLPLHPLHPLLYPLRPLLPLPPLPHPYPPPQSPPSPLRTCRGVAVIRSSAAVLPQSWAVRTAAALCSNAVSPSRAPTLRGLKNPPCPPLLPLPHPYPPRLPFRQTMISSGTRACWLNAMRSRRPLRPRRPRRMRRRRTRRLMGPELGSAPHLSLTLPFL